MKIFKLFDSGSTVLYWPWRWGRAVTCVSGTLAHSWTPHHIHHTPTWGQVPLKNRTKTPPNEDRRKETRGQKLEENGRAVVLTLTWCFLGDPRRVWRVRLLCWRHRFRLRGAGGADVMLGRWCWRCEEKNVWSWKYQKLGLHVHVCST